VEEAYIHIHTNH